MKEILFICTHNSARSQMAEAMVNALHGDRYKAYSAGTESTSINPYVIMVMSEIGINMAKQKLKSVKEFRGCARTQETCPFFPGKKFFITVLLISQSFRAQKNKFYTR